VPRCEQRAQGPRGRGEDLWVGGRVNAIFISQTLPSKDGGVNSSGSVTFHNKGFTFTQKAITVTINYQKHKQMQQLRRHISMSVSKSLYLETATPLL